MRHTKKNKESMRRNHLEEESRAKGRREAPQDKVGERRKRRGGTRTM